MNDWLHIVRGDAPLVVAFPHTGEIIPEGLEQRLVSPWRARMDTDWWVDRVYDFVADLGATTVRTAISRAVIDVNRDPEGGSLYPGQATTELCPLTTFDGEPLYRDGMEPDEHDISVRTRSWFSPYHDALQSEISRLRARHGQVVLYDAHSIRSRVPRLFEGELPVFNVGTNSAAACAPALRDAVARIVRDSGHSHAIDGRFRGGWTTRHYGKPESGVHAVQMELAQRAYMHEPSRYTPADWPTPFDPARAIAAQNVLRPVLAACLGFIRDKEDIRETPRQ